MTFRVLENCKQITFIVEEPFKITNIMLNAIAGEIKPAVSVKANKQTGIVTVELLTKTHEEIEDAEMQLYDLIDKHLEAEDEN